VGGQGGGVEATGANDAKVAIPGELAGGSGLSCSNKKSRGNQVVATLQLHFGDENTLKGQEYAGQFAGQMLMRGTAKHTRQQIKDEFDRLKASVMVSGTASGYISPVVRFLNFKVYQFKK